MYLDHFQFKSQPFCEHAQVHALWHDQRSEEGMARLLYLVTHGTLGLLTGQTGVGKSALLKRFLASLPPKCEAVYCHLSQLNSAGILKTIISRMGETPRRGKERIYEQILERASHIEGTLLIVLDEAHLLSTEALTDLRLLISSALDVGPPLRMLLVGQELLRATLKHLRHADLLNRASVRHQLRPLAKDQTTRYIDFQLCHAGGDARIIDDGVKGLIHDFTGGVCRGINNLATACLIQATAKRQARVDEEMFHQATHDFQLG